MCLFVFECVFELCFYFKISHCNDSRWVKIENSYQKTQSSERVPETKIEHDFGAIKSIQLERTKNNNQIITTTKNNINVDWICFYSD